MRKNETAVIVARVQNFDPNRPDLNDFLNSLVAETFEGEKRMRKPRRPVRESDRPSRTPRSRRSR